MVLFLPRVAILALHGSSWLVLVWVVGRRQVALLLLSLLQLLLLVLGLHGFLQITIVLLLCLVKHA